MGALGPGRLARVGAVLLGLGGADGLAGAPITFNTALPVARGEFVFRGQLVVDRSGDDPSGARRDRRTFSAISVLGYGVNRDLAVFGVLPHVDRELAVTGGGGRITRDATGFGDASVFGRYTVLRRDGPGRTFRVAPFAGVELPTGADNESDARGRLPAGLQPGSGSYDPFGGVVATYQTLAFQLDAQASYRANTEAGGFELGDVARLDGSLQYRLLPRRLGRGVPGFLYGVLELNLAHRGKSRAGGVKDPNTGGTTVSVVPGLQYVTKRWLVEGGVQLPLLEDLNGAALEGGYTLRAGFRVNF